MRADRRRDGRGTDGPMGGLAATGVAALAVVCCAGGPLLAAAAPSVALGTVLGAGAGVVALVALTALVVVRARRRRACTPTSPTTRKGGRA